MTDKKKIDDLRLSGMKPKEIAATLGIPYNNVRAYIRRHPEIEGVNLCKECKSPIPLTPGRRRYSFCCAACKTKWFNNARNTRGPARTCKYCGKEYRSYGSKSYCSRACYLNAVREG